jgi:hypothetical protein
MAPRDIGSDLATHQLFFFSFMVGLAMPVSWNGLGLMHNVVGGGYATPLTNGHMALLETLVSRLEEANKSIGVLILQYGKPFPSLGNLLSD